MKQFRTETDSMGEMQAPADYGAQTARALENFPISGLRFPREFIRALGLIKKHAAKTNAALDLLPEKVSQAIQQAAQEVIDGKPDPHFVVDIFQTGSGTSTNMNANEVIANRASEFFQHKPHATRNPCLNEYENHPSLSQPQRPSHLAPAGGGTTQTLA